MDIMTGEELSQKVYGLWCEVQIADNFQYGLLPDGTVQPGMVLMNGAMRIALGDLTARAQRFLPEAQSLNAIIPS